MLVNHLSKTELKVSVDAYKNTITDPNETKNGFIGLQHLKDFIKYVDDINKANPGKIDGIRIYFVRGISKWPYKLLDGDTEQISFAIVPTYEYNNGKDDNNGYKYYDKENPNKRIGGAKNYFETDGNIEKIICLFPGMGSNENSGLCPPNCGGEDI